uniref:RIMS-binding protein 2 n=1 Tax=Periophthalmus magnuspinnatus TaxID=409849 RepID=A0A3B4AIT8_9GOBI
MYFFVIKVFSFCILVFQNGTDYNILVRQNSELLRALDALEKTCATLREENGLLRKSSAPETEEKVRRLRRKNTELAILAKRLEDRALKLQEANLRVRSPVSSGEFEKLLRESQKEVLRLQRQLSVTSSTQQHSTITPDDLMQCGGTEKGDKEKRVYSTPHTLESELSKKRKECENLEHEAKKRQRRCLDLENQLEEERCKNEQLKEETDLLRRKAQLLYQVTTENDELREDLSEVTAQHNSVLEENQRLRAKLENLEQVLKHMREVAERRQQLELEHEQALAILKFKQDEIKRLQRAQLFAKREHEGVVQMLESTLDCMQSKVRDLEEKCRGQSEQFGLLSQELEKFRMQASKVDLAASTLPNNPSLSVLTNGLGLTRSPVTKHRELPTISVSKSLSSSSKSEATRLTPKSDTHLSPHKSTSEVEELDIDVAPAPYSVNRGASKLQVFIARYSYNPYDGPNDNPEVELPLTAGEYIYVYGDMDEDGFYEGELMDGRRGLVPSNFVERVSDDEVIGSHHPETVDISHNSLLDSSLHSASHQHYLHTGVSGSQRTESSAAPGPAYTPADPALALAVPTPLTNGLDLDFEEVGVDIVPYPRKLTLIKQLAKSIIIGWDPPSVPAGWGNVLSYSVYVDQELRLSVPFGSQNKAVLERLDITLKTYRVSVQSLTEKGPSDQLRCSMLVGRDVSVAPTQLNIDRVTATTANLSWLPCNSNYVHIVSLNGEEYELVKAGCYSLCLTNLCPSLQYTVKVEARPHRTPWELPVERREHRVSTVTFKTLMAGPPDAPLDVQLEQGPSPGIALISWLPVTIDAAGTSNGVRVTGYSIYADKRKVLEVSSPTAGSVLLGPSQIQSLQGARELTVRSMSAHGESCDSLPVNVPFKLDALLTGPSITPPVVPPPPCVPVSPCSLPSPESDEEVVERILKLPPQVYQSKQLSIIPETTEEEDRSLQESLLHHTQPRTRPRDQRDPRDPREPRPLQHAPQHLPAPHTSHHLNPRAVTKEPLLRHDGPQVRSKTHLRVHYADPVESCYPEEDPSVYQPITSRRPSARCPPQPNPPGRALLKGLGDRLRREAMLRSQMAASATSCAPTRPHPISKSVHTVRAPMGRAAEIDVEYGTDTEEPAECGQGEVVMEQMSSEWWVDAAQKSRPLRHPGPKPQPPSVTAGQQQWVCCPRSLLYLFKSHNMSMGLLPLCECVCVSEGCIESPKGKGGCNIRLFVALFSYDPASMSPNPGAIEEELPFIEGQIIQVFGDKDADGFYHGECAGRVGLVPCNMVSEIQVEDEETRQHLLKQGTLSTVSSVDKLGNCTHAQLPRRAAPPPKPRRSKKGAVGGAAAPLPNPGPETRKMVAIFDYDPRESSPNTDIEAELTFSAGDIIHVMGDMDEDGFFYGDLNGQRGLVPSNFLQPLLESNTASLHPPEPKRERRRRRLF